MAGEMMQPEQAAAPQEQGASGGDQLTDLITNIGTGMEMLAEVVQSAGLPGPVVQKLGALLEGFKSFAGDLAGGAQPQQASQLASPEQGGAQASPANPGMRG